jgi:hypothetical protein
MKHMLEFDNDDILKALTRELKRRQPDATGLKWTVFIDPNKLYPEKYLIRMQVSFTTKNDDGTA